MWNSKIIITLKIKISSLLILEFYRMIIAAGNEPITTLSTLVI
jgi:hypothetical protein